MARISRRSLSRSANAAYLCICVALVLLLALTWFGYFRDTQFIRTTLLQSKLDSLRSHARRTVDKIEEDLRAAGAEDLQLVNQKGWDQSHLSRLFPEDDRTFYAAILTDDGTVVMHSDSSRKGRHLRRNWYSHVLFDFGNDVVETSSPALATGDTAYDLRLPVKINGREVGEYHVGMDVDWFERWNAEKQASFVQRRTILIGGALLIVLFATSSLYYIAWHSISLRRAIESAALERATEVGKLAAGLAHEVRNPLHAIQLNMHTFRRVRQQQGAGMTPVEIDRMLCESTREINRIEQLMQQLVRFATPDEPRSETINLTAEIADMVEFLQQESLDKQVEIHSRLPAAPVLVHMDRGRLRQILLNLIQNAQQALERGGRVDVTMTRRRGRVEISVMDNGPGVPLDEREQVFEPFFSTKSDGMGLGLALVKRFVDEVGGEVRCDANPHGGARFTILLQEIHAPRSR